VYGTVVHSIARPGLAMLVIPYPSALVESAIDLAGLTFVDELAAALGNVAGEVAFHRATGELNGALHRIVGECSRFAVRADVGAGTGYLDVPKRANFDASSVVDDSGEGDATIGARRDAVRVAGDAPGGAQVPVNKRFDLTGLVHLNLALQVRDDFID